MYKCRCITQITNWFQWWGPSSASKLLSALCSDLAVLKFPTLLADVQRPN